jgi:hypothetical protein
MKFILTSLFKLTLFLLLVAIIYEIAYELLLYYYSLLITGEAISLQGFIS